MKKLIHVDDLVIGRFSFRGFIVDKGNNLMAYSIFVDEMDEPFVELVADEKRNVRIGINYGVLNFINKNKTADKNLRKAYFKEFYNFIIASEKKASYMVFKNQKLNYVKKSSEIIELKKIYIDS